VPVVRLFLAGDRVGPQLRRSGIKIKKQILDAERGAAQDVVDYVVPKVRSDIAKSGKFKGHWLSDFTGKITEGGGFIRVSFTHADFRWRVFEYGAVIHGKPLLWIPLSFAKDAQGIRARDYPGRLFRVDRKSGGAPLLLGGNPATPKFFGKASVTIPKKWHMTQIIGEGATKMKTFYNARMKSNG